MRLLPDTDHLVTSSLQAMDAQESEGHAQESEDHTQSPKQLLSRFYAMQEERVQTYQLFEEGFQAYLRQAPHYHFPLYRQLVHEITQTFNKISQEILAIKSRLAATEGQDLITIANFIDKVQDSEKRKLELTARLQICRQKQVDEPGDGSVASEMEDIKKELSEIKDSLIETMEELKYESEELYTEDSPADPTESTSQIDR